VLAGTRRTDKKRKTATFNLDPDLLYQVKVRAAIEAKSISELAEAAFSEYLQRDPKLPERKT
jgi:hypothetical protein